MAQLSIVYWRDIPAQVIVKAGRQAAKRQLTERFEKAIDRAAMKAKLRDTDSYLAEWRRAGSRPRGLPQGSGRRGQRHRRRRGAGAYVGARGCRDPGPARHRAGAAI